VGTERRGAAVTVDGAGSGADAAGNRSYATELEAATRGLLEVNEQALESMGETISLDHLRALQALRRLGSTSTVGELAVALATLSSTVSRLSDRLSADGLITRRPSPRDRRSTVLELAAAGQAVLDELVALRIDAFERVICSMGRVEREALLFGTRAFTQTHAHLAQPDSAAPEAGAADDGRARTHQPP